MHYPERPVVRAPEAVPSDPWRPARMARATGGPQDGDSHRPFGPEALE